MEEAIRYSLSAADNQFDPISQIEAASLIQSHFLFIQNLSIAKLSYPDHGLSQGKYG